MKLEALKAVFAPGRRLSTDDAVNISDVNISDVFWAGEGGYAAVKIPGFVALQPHPIALAFGEGRRYSCADFEGQHDLLSKRSTDRGRSWSALNVLVNVSMWGTDEAGPHGGAVWDITPVFDKVNAVLHVLFSRQPARYNKPCTDKPQCENEEYAYPQAREQWELVSHDLGATFSPPINRTSVLQGTWAASACCVTFSGGKGVQLRNGSLLVPGYHCHSCEKRDCDPEAMHLWASHDFGRTWQVTPEFAFGCAEGEVAEVPGATTLFASMRIDASEPKCQSPTTSHCRRTMTSTNGGDDWSAPRDLGQLPDPGCKGGLTVWEAGGGIVQANDANPTKRTNISVHISRDGGLSFPYSRQLDPRPTGGYAVLDMVGPNTIAVLYERAAPGTCVGTNMSLALVDARSVMATPVAPVAPPPPPAASPECLAAGSRWCSNPAESHCDSNCTLARFDVSDTDSEKQWRCFSPQCFDASGRYHSAVGCDVCSRDQLLADVVKQCMEPSPPAPPPPPASAKCLAAGSYWCSQPGESHCDADCTLARFDHGPGTPSKDWRCYSKQCFNSSGQYHFDAGCDICSRGALLAAVVTACAPAPPPAPASTPGGNYTGRRWMTWYNSAGVLDADNMLHTGANLVWSTNLTDLIRIGRDPRYSSLSAMWSIEAFCSGYFGQQIFNEPYCSGGIGLNENWTAGVKLAVGLIAPLEHVKGVFLGVRAQTFVV